MRIQFRQGIVSHQQGFLSVNGSGNVDLLTNNRPCTVSIAHRNTNYLFSESNNVTNAWTGPFLSTQDYWLYWDFNLLTFQRTFGVTTLEPVAQSVAPGRGNAPVVDIVTGVGGVATFYVDHQFAIPVGKQFMVVGSTGNDGTYTVQNATFNGNTGQTEIIVNETISDGTVDGELTLDIDAYGIPLKTNGRHWFDTSTNQHFVLNGSVWTPVFRVFAAQLTNGNTFLPQTITLQSFIGTQIGNTVSVLAGRPLFDANSNALHRDDGTLLTTEDQFFAEGAKVDGIRLEANIVRAQVTTDLTIPEFGIVAWRADGKVSTAQYEDTGNTVVGVLLQQTVLNEVGAVMIRGIVENPNWQWLTGSSPTTVGSYLWIDNGQLVTQDPASTNNTAHPVINPPVARVLSDNSIVFDQGTEVATTSTGGGSGPGTPVVIPPASTSDLGIVKMSVPPVSAVDPIAVGNNDPRMTDARTALPHTHAASAVTVTPASGITSNTVQLALQELSTKKLNLTGGTLTGALTLPGSPTALLHAATKQYVDGLVSGLLWLNPVDLINMISDNVTNPPVAPNYSDSYIVPGGATGAWALIPTGNVVTWDGSQWVDLGSVTNINALARFGVAMTSSTTPSGSFAGQKNNIAVFDSLGSLSSFQIPSNQNAVYVRFGNSLNSFIQYVFTGTQWILFGSSQAIAADGTTIVQNGNILSVKQFASGGEIDAKFWQGLIPSDLNTVYAAFSHTHNASDITGGSFPDSVVSETAVTQHEGALTITESQISDLGNYLQDISSQSIKDLSDVNSLMSPVNGQVLTYDNINGWQAQTPGSGVTDHGLLTGLGDDDHPQYHNDTRGDARYYTQTQLNTGQLDTRYYTESEVNTLLLNKADTVHTQAASTITSGTFNNARIAESNVTQHEGALTITESQISDLGNYTVVGHQHSAGDITSGTFNNARIAESNVTQHEGALTITESQISDLGNYIQDITNESLGDLNDVDLTGSPALASGDVLTYDGSNWVPSQISGGTLDHGTLVGLGDDDHPQYHNDTRGDARYYTQALLDGGQLDTRYYTESEVDSLLGNKANTTHVHDAGDVTTGQFTNPRISQSSVTQHEGALTITESQISDLGNYIPTSEKGAANGVVPLGATSKIASTYLPAIAITDTFVVASQPAMLALTAETGDVAVRTDENKSYILQGTDPSVLGDWQELLSPPGSVTSVDGLTGVVDLSTVYEPLFSKNTAFNKDFGTTAGTVAEGDHTHPTSTVTVTPYTSSPDWGTPSDATTVQLNSTQLQNALEEIVDEKASKTPVYATSANLPTAANVKGMVAYVDDVDELQVSDGSQWVSASLNDGAVQDHDHDMPYDIALFIPDLAADTASKTMIMFVAPKTITVTGNAATLQGYAKTPPGANVTFDVKKNGTNVGTVTFNNGSNTPSSSTVSGTTFVLNAGDRLEIVSPSVTESTIADVAITITGCALLSACPV